MMHSGFEELASEQSPHVRVIARIRPFLAGETAPAPPCISVQGNTVVTQDPTTGVTTAHPFDIALGPEATQEAAYQAIAADVSRVLAGVPMLLMAYGVTSAGKSYTLFGSGEDLGLFGKATHALFEMIASSPLVTPTQICIRVSAVQIYLNTVTDMLNEGVPLKVHGAGPDPLPDRAWVPVTSPEACIQVIRDALARREVASTTQNARSSRSHCIVTLAIDDLATGQTSGLTVVDLAGSEPHMVGASKLVQQESSFIRTSLLMLDRALKDLRNITVTRTTSVSFRSSQLTMALRPFLQPTPSLTLPCNAVMFLNLHGRVEAFASNKDTLQLGLVAKSVRNYSKTASRLGLMSSTAASLAGSMTKSLSRSTRQPPDDVQDDSVVEYGITTTEHGDLITIPLAHWNSILEEVERLSTALDEAGVTLQEELQIARQEVVTEMTQLMEINVAHERAALLTDIVERDAMIERLQRELVGVATRADALSKQLYVSDARLQCYESAGPLPPALTQNADSLGQLNYYRSEAAVLRQRLTELEDEHRRSMSELNHIRSHLQRASESGFRMSALGLPIPAHLMGTTSQLDFDTPTQTLPGLRRPSD